MTHDMTPILAEKVHEWIGKEGYPLEFSVANAARISGFRVEQGAHVRDSDQKPREVDVLASIHKIENYRNQHLLVRFYNVIECKWSRDKPWVVLTSKFGRIMETAAVAQTISSEIGESACWVNTGNDCLLPLSIFASPERVGFGGRQAFSGKSDYFYNSVQSVTGNAIQLAKSYNRYSERGFIAAVCFPVIVVEGTLFEAFQDSPEDELRLLECSTARCFWRGAEDRELRVPVDIVTKNALPAFMEKRRTEADILVGSLMTSVKQMVDVKIDGDPKALKVWSGSTGMSGRPQFIHNLFRENNDEDASQRKA